MFNEMLAQEVENHETLFTCNGTPKIVDKEKNEFDEVVDIYNCQYCDCTDCNNRKIYQ